MSTDVLSHTPAAPPSPNRVVPRLELGGLPPIFVSATHFRDEELHELEGALEDAGAAVTYDIAEAGIILSKVTKKTRILFDLRAKGLSIEEADPRATSDPLAVGGPSRAQPVVVGSQQRDQRETVVVEDSSTESEPEGNVTRKQDRRKYLSSSPRDSKPSKDSLSSSTIDEGLVRVLRVEWFEDSRKQGYATPFDEYATFFGRRSSKQGHDAKATPEYMPQTLLSSPASNSSPQKRKMPPPAPSAILERAKNDASQTSPRSERFNKRKFGHHGQPASTAAKDSSWSAGHQNPRYARLLHSTTSEEEQGSSDELPEAPEWVKAGIKYACQRPTPADSPNVTFISLLKKIRVARVLTEDEIGVRAYSTSIAALAAYPYKIVHPREILRLPGCDAKIANLFVEWANTGKIQAVEDIDSDGDLKVLRMFYDIWGVGSTTAREFYYDHGWRDLDDLVEYNWRGLSRVQQIGVKFYDEFLESIPRAEVEAIGSIVHRHAVKVRDGDVQSLIVGGYRRGKAASGDVDIVVSHPDESKTLNIVTDIVASLEEEGWVTHTLLLSLNSTHRDQQTLPFRSGSGHGGHGFDSLDKALVVWQDPTWHGQKADLAADPKSKNPNIHRRVDIIVSTWRTVGCAVAGWSGGTTFQRDIRRYAKNVHGWKFDSSGVRDRAGGQVLDLEGHYRYNGSVGTGRARTMVQAEKRVFEGLGLVYREPWERCTD